MRGPGTPACWFASVWDWLVAHSMNFQALSWLPDASLMPSAHEGMLYGFVPAGPAWVTLAWLVGGGWAALHFVVVTRKGTPVARRLARVNVWFEAVAGAVLVATGTASLLTGQPLEAPWFATKILLFGLVFWVTLGIDIRFQPFTMVLRMGPRGSTPETEAAVTRQTNQTMLWALLLYALVASIAFLGKVKPG